MKSYEYPRTPGSDIYVDVIIPFHEKDAHFLGECVTAILASNYITPILHLVADGCLFPPIPEGRHTHKYFTEKGTGAYRITNALIPFLQTKYFAVQDVDDISHPDRLWKQAATLQVEPMTTCSMIQEPTPGYKGARHVTEPIINPGVKYSTTPYGRVVNGTRMIRVETFKALNGFQNMFCSGDFQFDNRILPLYNCHYSLEVLATRRLHPVSISNGREEVYPNMNRASFVNEIKKAIREMKSRTLEKARALGALDKPVQITRL